MEIRYHTTNTVKTLIKRAKGELKKSFYELFKAYYKYIVSAGHSVDMIYVELSRCLVFLKYVQVLRMSLDELELEDINDFLASRESASTRRWYMNVLRNFS